MDSLKIKIDADTKEFKLEVPFDTIKELVSEERSINIPPETIKQVYYFQSKSETPESFFVNVALKDNYEEEYDKEFWEDYHKQSEEEFSVSNQGIEDTYDIYIDQTAEEVNQDIDLARQYVQATNEDTYGDQSTKQSEI